MMSNLNEKKKGFVTGEAGCENNEKSDHSEIMQRVSNVRRSVGYLEKSEVSLQTALYFLGVDNITAQAVGRLAHTPQIKSASVAINDLVADVKAANFTNTINSAEFKTLKKIAIAIGGRRESEEDYNTIINFFTHTPCQDLVIEMVSKDDQNGQAIVIKIPTLRGVKTKTYDDLSDMEKIHRNLWVYSQYNVLNADRDILKTLSIDDEWAKAYYTGKIKEMKEQYLRYLIMVNDYNDQIIDLVNKVNVDDIKVRWAYWLNKNI